MSKRLVPLIVNAPQRTTGWFQARLGNLTGSKAEVAMSYSKPTAAQMTQAYKAYMEQEIDEQYIKEMMEDYPWKFCLDIGIELQESAARKGYREGIVAERFTGMSADLDPYITRSMQWGQAQELPARYKYQDLYGHHVEEAPLMLHPEWLCGASPDGLVVDIHTGELGNLEIKCLDSKNHMYKILRDKRMPDDYKAQVQMQMWITGRDWCDFVGYDSRVPNGLQIYVVRVRRDDFYIDNILVPSIKQFLDECDHDERLFHAIEKEQLERLKAKMLTVEEMEQKWASPMTLQNS